MKNLLFIILLLVFSINLFSQETQNKTEEKVFIIVEMMPVFTKKCLKSEKLDEQNQCSMKAVQKYVSKVHYPSKAIKKNKRGKVYIRFNVGKTGKVEKVILLRSSGHKILDKAALNHIKNMPKWAKPGFQRGKTVRVQYKIPIHFILE